MTVVLVQYLPGVVPAGYACKKCGVSGVKLWRDYITFAPTESLRCVNCACKAAGINPESVYPSGLRAGGVHSHGLTNQIGNMVPAIPSHQKDGRVYAYWGVASVSPEIADIWWAGLPLRK